MRTTMATANDTAMPGVGIDWIPAGQQFGFDDLVFWQGKGEAPFSAVAKRIDTIVLGPHASARFPAELRPFVDAGLTRRKQYDYSDVITSSLGRAWAAADPGVVFVESPHSRLAHDPNRAPPADVMSGLREFFARLERQRAGEKVAFGGIDAVRPITFSGETVLRPPADEAEWSALAARAGGGAPPRARRVSRCLRQRDRCGAGGAQCRRCAVRDRPARHHEHQDARRWRHRD